MIAPIACDALWRAPHSERLGVVRQWALFVILALGAACLNPYGPEIILVTFRTVALGAALTTVTEWRSQDFTHLGGSEIIMLGAFGFAFYRGVTLPWLRILMVLGVLHRACRKCVTLTCLESRADLSGSSFGRAVCGDRHQPDSNNVAPWSLASSRNLVTVDRRHWLGVVPK